MGLRFLILIPVGLLLVFALSRVAVGRPLPKRTANVVLALLLLGYFSATAGLGIFWVSTHELPVFDLHYLVGYATLLLVLVHVAFNWQTVTGFLRTRAPKVLTEPGARAWRPALRIAAWTVGLAVYGGVFYWIGRGQGTARIEISRVVSAQPDTAVRGAPERQASSKTELPPAGVIEHQTVTSAGKQRTLADYYHEESKHTRVSVVLDAGGLDWSAQPGVYKAYPDAEVIELPEPAEFAGISVGAAIDACRQPVHAFGTDAVTLTDISTMLHMTNGITGSVPGAGRTYCLRAAPSAGALYPTVTYLIARNVEGLPPGIYHYAVDEHKLHRLRAGAELGERLASFVSRGELVRKAPATFVYTSVFHRSAWKYGKRAYRYCAMDAGHLAVQTALSAAALGYGSRPIGRFDDAKVNALLDLDEREEGAMLILPVGIVSEESQDPPGRPEFALAPKELTGKSNALLLLIHGSTYLSLTGDTVRAFPTTQPADKTYDGLPAVDLVGGPADDDDLFAAILRRRSIREWADPGMTFEQLALVMHCAFGISREEGGLLGDPSVEENRALNLYVIVHRVEGLEHGVYYCRRHEHTLTQIRTGDHRGRSYAASLFQDAVGGADAVLVVAADMQRLGYPDGDRGYRYACLNAGMLGGRVYLQATGLGLGCCGIGAFFDDEVGDLIGVRPEKERVLYMVALGAREPGTER